MTDYKTPGVYVNEIPPAAGPMQGASTSVAAFVGAIDLASQQITFTPPVQVFTNFTQFKKAFKDSNGVAPTGDRYSYLANAVFGFFNNGGTRCYVTVADTTPPDSVTLVSAMGQAMVTTAMAAPYQMSRADATALVQQINTGLAATNVTLKSALDAVKGGIASIEDLLGSLVDDLVTIAVDAANAEVEDENAAAATGSGAAAPVVTHTALPSLESMNPANQGTLAKALTDAGAAAAKQWDTDSLSPGDIAAALRLLEPFEEISIVAAPGSTDAWDALQTHCGTYAQNRFAILDCPRDEDWASSAPKAADVPQQTEHRVSAIYFPWITVTDVTDTVMHKQILVPPSGHMAGVYARVDAQRGVFKAPANVSVSGALDLAYRVSSRQQEQLNDPLGINCIRRLNGSILVWGARTVQTLPGDAFTYISTRRTFNYIRASLEQSTQWAVFEPNTQALWGQIIRNVTTFLKTLWQSGGLFGATAAEAFYVKCDEETNPPDVRAAGQVVTEIGVAITTPAEFVVFNLGVMTQAPGASS
ncbi:MAG: phage tail sheath C-terminal domain-containing protein [Byssovorax sp.]